MGGWQGAELAFEQIARHLVCARVDKAYIYWWKQTHKSYIEGVHLSITDTLTDSQPGRFGGPVIFSFSPRADQRGHSLQPSAKIAKGSVDLG